jgi:acetylornithine deacetylase/succinyl-diaminopimelate desuccinylase-like protein
VPGETYASVTNELAALLTEIERTIPGLRTGVRRVAGSMATMEHRALVTDPRHPLARATVAARRTVLGDAAAAEPAVAFPAWTDGALLDAFGGVPTVVLGPGDLADAHSPRESLATDELEAAARLYAAIALAFLAGEHAAPAAAPLPEVTP